MMLGISENRPSVGATPRKCLSARGTPQYFSAQADPNSSRLAIVMLQQPAEFFLVSRTELWSHSLPN